jgi:methyl-accepting chemotaxis protein
MKKRRFKRFQIKIGRKIIIGFLIMAVILGLTSLFSYFAIKKIDRSYSNILSQQMELLVISKNIQVNATQLNNKLREYLLSFNVDILREFTVIHTNIIELVKSATEKAVREDELNQLKRIDQYTQEINQNFELLVNMDRDSTNEFANTHLIPLAENIREMSDQLAMEQIKMMDEESSKNSNMISFINAIFIAINIAAVSLSIIIGYIISRMISKPMKIMESAAKQIAVGDLTVDLIHIKNRDEIGLLANSFNQMIQNLRSLIHQVQESAEQIATSAEELSASAEQTSAATEHIANSIEKVSGGVTEQVQSLEATSQGIQEMSSSVQQISENASEVYSTAILASERASDGNKVVQTMVHQMNSISVSIEGLAQVINALGISSNKIGQIVQVISEIAEQTHLLALNAAIEAARAGEQGRGFAVVADEVRKLAEQSSDSAENIKNLIIKIQEETKRAIQSMDTATNEVNEGISLVHSVGEIFDVIRHSSNDVAQQIGDVTAAVQRIYSTTEQIVQTVNKITDIADEVAVNMHNVSSATEEQLASMEEISAASVSLSGLSEKMQMNIHKFKV